jgi:hypothetical protein
MSARRISFYQCRPIGDLTSRGIEAEIAVGDLTLMVYRFNASTSVSVRVEAFTDCMSTWRRLDKMRVFYKIERAELRDADDLARLLVNCGLRHVPAAGYQYTPDGGAAERARVKALHSSDT